MQGRGPFRALNRTVNPALGLLLRSPLHRLAGGRFAPITYAGRGSGRQCTLPVLYREAGDEVTIGLGWPDGRVWCRNLTGAGGPVGLLAALPVQHRDRVLTAALATGI